MKRFRPVGLLFLLGSCEPQHAWNVAHLQAEKECYNSSRLSYRVHDMVNEVAVEMVCSLGQLNTYLVVYSQTIPPYKGNPKEAYVRMKTSQATIEGVGYRHDGGQRIALPSDLQQFLIDSLLQGEMTTLALDGYSANLTPDHFAQRYKELQVQPFNNPLQLPFKL